MNDHKDEPPLTAPPAAFRDETHDASRDAPTQPDASPTPITIPPPVRSGFEAAMAKLVEVHEQQLQNYRDLHDEEGPLGRLHTQLDLVLHEVRQIRGDWGSAQGRILKLETRADELEKLLRELTARVRELEVKPDAATTTAPAAATP